MRIALQCDGSLDQSLMVDSLSYFSFKPVFHNRYNKCQVVPVLWNEAVRMDQSLMVDPLTYFSFNPVFHNWYNKVCGMYYQMSEVATVL